jgi:hypothetical protein
VFRLSDVLWKVQCHLNGEFPWSRTSYMPVRFIAQGDSIDVLGVAYPPPVLRPELCIVLTTHRRAQACSDLLIALRGSLDEAGRTDVFIVVFNDRSPDDYSRDDYGGVLETLTQCFPGRHAFYESTEWLGKPRFWFTYDNACRAVRRLSPEHVLFLQDDVALAGEFIRRLFSAWEAIEDSRKAVLYLCVMPDDEKSGRWIYARRRDLPGGAVRRTQWFDLSAFLVNRRFFDLLRYQVFPVNERRWYRDRSRSSSVGEQLTRRLFGRAASGDHVGRKRPGRPAKAQQCRLVGEFRPQLLDRLVDRRKIHVKLFAFELSDLLRPDRRHQRSVAFLEAQVAAQCVRHHEDIGKKDRCIETETPDRLQGNLGREFRIVAKVEETAGLLASSAVFRQVAPSLAHHPDGRGKGHLSFQHSDDQSLFPHRNDLCGLTSKKEKNPRKKDSSDSMTLSVAGLAACPPFAHARRAVLVSGPLSRHVKKIGGSRDSVTDSND